MATKKGNQSKISGEHRVSASVDDLLTAALARGDESLETGRYIVTYKENAGDDAARSLSMLGMPVADARDFHDQAARLEAVGDAEAVMFPEIGAAVISGGAFRQRAMNAQAEIPADSPIEAIEPEYFVYAHDDASSLYLRGFAGSRVRGFGGSGVRGGCASPRPTNPDVDRGLQASL
jgi:subtilisin